MAYTGSVDFSLINGVQMGYAAKAKNVQATDEAASSFEDALADVNETSDDIEMKNDKTGDADYKAAELAGSGANRKEALNNVAKNEFENSDMEQQKQDELAGLMQGLIGELMAMLCEKLGMTEDELKAALEGLDMTEADLLDAGNITQFVVEVKADGNMAELLTDEDLHAVVTELTDELKAGADDISKELGKEFEQLKADFAEVVKPEVKSVKVADNSNNPDMSNGTYNGEAMFGEIVNNIANNISEISGTQVTTDIVSQVIEQIKLRVTEDVTSMELQLTPEELGRINLQVSAKDGVVTAQITTETLIAKEAIESQVALLKESLNEQGIKVEEVEVTVASHQFDSEYEDQRENDNEQQQSARRRFIDVSNEEEQQFDEAAVIAREIMMSGGNRMDIRA